MKQSPRLQNLSGVVNLTKDELWRLVVWPYLQQKGWTFVAGSTALHDWSYLRPGKKKSDGTRGVDYYEGWASALEAVTSDGMLQKQDVKDATVQALRTKQRKGKAGDDDKEDDEDEEDDEGDDDEEDDDDEDDDATDMENEESIATRTPRTIQELSEYVDYHGGRTDDPIPNTYEYQVIEVDGRTTMKQLARSLKCEPALLALVNRCECVLGDKTTVWLTLVTVSCRVVSCCGWRRGVQRPHHRVHCDRERR